MGENYTNDLFVGDFNNGNLYHFELNQNRTGLLLNGPLTDKIADSHDELDDVVFAGGFHLVSDLEIGPDGYLYVIAFNEGKIYRVLPKNADEDIPRS